MNREIEDALAYFTYISENLMYQNNIELVYKSTLVSKRRVFSWKHIKKAWLDYISTGKRIDLYVNVPFCSSLCSYCIYPSKIPGKGDIEIFLRMLRSQVKSITSLNISPKALYIGGGTPSILSPEELKELFHILSCLPIDKDGEKTLEVNPKSTTKEKLLIAKQNGINRISLGVQSLDPEVLRLNNRPDQPEESIERCIRWIKELEMESGADMVLGLKGDTTETFLRSFARLLELGTDQIFVYPILTSDKIIDKEYGSKVRFDEMYKALHDSVAEGILEIYPQFREAKSLQYVNPTAFANRSKNFRYRYGHHPMEPIAVLGLGPFANSIIPGKLNYTLAQKDYASTVFIKDFKINELVYEGEEYDPSYQKVEYIVRKVVSDFRISFAEYTSIFQKDIRDEFGDAISSLIELGIARYNENGIQFEKMDEPRYFRYLLFFVGKEKAGNIGLTDKVET